MNICRIHSAPEYATYSLDNLDFPLKFGAKGSGADDCHKYICIAKDPVKVWIIGEVQALGFKKAGFNARRAGVLINPLRDEDRLRMKDIITNLSHPPRRKQGPPYPFDFIITHLTLPAPVKDDIWIGKWMASRDAEESAVGVLLSDDFPTCLSCASKIPAFTDTLDICSGVQGQPKFAIDVLKKYDIVAVEALICRYTNNYKTWNEWRASLQLNRLFLLLSVDASQIKVDTQLF